MTNVTFDMPGSLISFQQDRDYSSDAGARSVTAYSSGQGSTTPYSTPQVGVADGRPAWQFRWQPAANVTSAAVLNQYAKGALAVLQPGKQSITLVVSTANAQGRRLGVDWKLGDDVGYSVAASYVNEQGATVQIRAFPNGLAGTGRVIGYSFDEMTVSPVLADKAVYVKADQS